MPRKRRSTAAAFIDTDIDVKVEPEEIKAEVIEEGNVSDGNFYCRICFKFFQLHDNKNELDSGTLSTLRELLQIGLRLSVGSQAMCDECSSLITSFDNFKSEVIDKQAKFSQLIITNKQNSAIEIQKISNFTHEFDQLQCSEVFVKQEISETEIPDFRDDNSKDPDYGEPVRKKAKVTTRTPTKRPYTKKSKKERIFEQCDECNIKVMNMLNHKIKKHGLKHLFECSNCSFSTYEKRKLQYHTQNVHSKKKNEPQDTSQICPHCAKQVRFLDMHIANIHRGERNFFCDLCSFSSFKRQPIEHHMMNIHLPKSVKCTLCDFVTYSQERLRSHNRNQHEERERTKDFVCSVPDCGKAFSKKINLTFHVKRCHEGEVKFSCDAPGCTKSFFSKSEKIVHFQNSHGPRNVICDECGAAFSSVAMLRKHSTLHQEYRYPCTFPNCSLKYRNSAQRKNHMNRVHLNKRDHKCEECSESFFIARDLENHVVAKHLGIRFACEVTGCTAALTRRDAYVNHLKSHSGLSDTYRQQLIQKCQEFCIKMNLKKK